MKPTNCGEIRATCELIADQPDVPLYLRVKAARLAHEADELDRRLTREARHLGRMVDLILGAA